MKSQTEFFAWRKRLFCSFLPKGSVLSRMWLRHFSCVGQSALIWYKLSHWEYFLQFVPKGPQRERVYRERAGWLSTVVFISNRFFPLIIRGATCTLTALKLSSPPVSYQSQMQYKVYRKWQCFIGSAGIIRKIRQAFWRSRPAVSIDSYFLGTSASGSGVIQPNPTLLACSAEARRLGLHSQDKIWLTVSSRKNISSTDTWRKVLHHYRNMFKVWLSPWASVPLEAL